MEEALYMFGALCLAIAVGVPIPIAIGVATVAGYYLIGLPYIQIAQSTYVGMDALPIMTVPLFVFAGALMEKGGMAQRIVGIAQSMVGNFTGSLGMVTVLGCSFFAALSGSGPATTAAIGSVTIPSMRKQGYSLAFCGALAAAGGALGVLIPPSNLMIIYGIVTDTSIPRLFLSGVFPGILASFFLILTVWVVARIRGYTGGPEAFSWARVGRACWDGKWSIGAPVVILGGIYSGIFTPTEAATVACFYALFVGVFINRELDLEKVLYCLKVTTLLAGSVLIILGCAKAFGELVSLMDVPTLLQKGLKGVTESPFVYIMIVSAILTFTGMFMESIAQIILLTPLFLPIAKSLGIDPITFGVILVLNCEIGFLTPPVGANLFVATRLVNLPIEKISVQVIPFLFAYFAVIILVALFPQLALWLPTLVMG
ncbi:MAG: TRAP transporter large permease [Alphaproteobacteria bacterium]|nr:TRAP transporter large permease [Alphaproteobacteria bacterium]